MSYKFDLFVSCFINISGFFAQSCISLFYLLRTFSLLTFPFILFTGIRSRIRLYEEDTYGFTRYWQKRDWSSFKQRGCHECKWHRRLAKEVLYTNTVCPNIQVSSDCSFYRYNCCLFCGLCGSLPSKQGHAACSVYPDEIGTQTMNKKSNGRDSHLNRWRCVH